VAHRPAERERDRLNWDDIRLFLEVARSGSFRKAADSMGLSANTLMRRIALLETRLGHILLARNAGGVRLTNEGHEVVRIGERLRNETLDLERMAKIRSRGLSGLVKVAVTEGLGTFWIIPRLVDFQQRHPELTIDLFCDMHLADMSSHQADVAVQIDRPADSNLVITRLGYLHLMLFASDEYLRLHGAPSRVEDLIDYHFVEQVAPQVPSEMIKTVVPNPFAKHFVSFVPTRAPRMLTLFRAERGSACCRPLRALLRGACVQSTSTSDCGAIFGSPIIPR
jgi:DNA-binding transcriptional LysR family regulator